MEKLAGGYGLVEGPVWDSQRGLLFSDVLNGGVFAVREGEDAVEVFPHRRGIGGMALHAAGGLVMSGRNVAFKGFSNPDTVMLLDRDESAGNVGYNDLTTDEAGRVYVGSLGSSPVFEDGRAPSPGKLYCIDVDGSAREVADDVRLTNGLGFSPDGRWLYHSDSGVRTVWRYPVEGDGRLGPRERFIRCQRGAPDGLVVSEDGRIWVALAAGGHGVEVWNADGSVSEFIEVPQPMCTSVCFGGEDLRTLFVVTGSEGSGENSGGVYALRAAVAGLPVPQARIALPVDD